MHSFFLRESALSTQAMGALIAAYFYLPFFQDLGILSINQVSENLLTIIIPIP